ncbi:MAG: DUF4351 domain-containing protein [Luteitalea sp.]|nr:DUF4351 domain-containing protein [Luteitalea sp.]
MSRPSYDETLKFLADIDPAAWLRVLGALPSDPSARVTPAPRELSAPLRLPDLLYEVSLGDTSWLAHIELQTRDDRAMDNRELEYAVLAWLRFRKPVRSYLVVLTPRGGARASPRSVVVRAGSLNITLRYRVIRLWEMSAAHILAADRPTLLPLVPLTRATDDELQEALHRLRMVPDEPFRRELASRFALVGSLRYNAIDLLTLVEERVMLDLEEFPLYQYFVEKGLEQGREQGWEQGETALLRRLLERRFGSLPSWAVARLEAADRATVEAWADRLLDTDGMLLEDLLR